MVVDKVRSIWGDVRSDVGDDSARSEDDEDERTRPESKLFSCPECDVVYLALEKERCSNCRSEVSEESPTLSKG